MTELQPVGKPAPETPSPEVFEKTSSALLTVIVSGVAVESKTNLPAVEPRPNDVAVGTNKSPPLGVMVRSPAESVVREV